MRYLKARGVEDNEFYYFEVDAQMTAYRQVSMREGEYKVSIAPDFHLTDQEVEVFEGDEEISLEAFNEVWEKAVEPYKASWEQAKQNYLLGDLVTGTIEMFYPHGVIIRLTEEVYAVTDDPQLRQQTRPEFMYPGNQVQGTVTHYDDTHFWLVLESCKVIEGK